MKKLYFLFLLFVQLGFSQDLPIEAPRVVESEYDNSIYNASGIEVKPEYPGGINEFYKLVAKNFNTPEAKGFKGGKIFIQFVIEKDGSLTDIKVIRDAGFGTSEEAIRVLKLSPKWLPAQQNGKVVRCSFVLPITITEPK